MDILIGVMKNYNCPLHKHKSYEIITYIQGNGSFCYNEKEIDVTSGTIIVIPPETLHGSYSFEEQFERIYMSGEFDRFFNLASPAVVYDNSENEGIMLAKMIYNNRYASPEYLSALTNAFARFLLQSINMEDELFLAINNIIEAISNNFYDCNINISDILKKSGYAEDYIRAQFKKITKKTPIEFLTTVRIEHARHLIDTYRASLSLADVAEKCGYTDYAYFSRRFKEITGISPKKYMESI